MGQDEIVTLIKSNFRFKKFLMRFFVGEKFKFLVIFCLNSTFLFCGNLGGAKILAGRLVLFSVDARNWKFQI